MQRIELPQFIEEVRAWDAILKKGKNVSPEISLEFSNWAIREDGKYLIRRYDNGCEVHIVWSPNYGCPLLLLRTEGHDIPVNLNEGFIGGFEYHPILDQVFYAVHACETRAWMSVLTSTDVPGIMLLSWWSVLANVAIDEDFLKITPEIFSSAIRSLKEAENSRQQKEG